MSGTEDAPAAEDGPAARAPIVFGVAQNQEKAASLLEEEREKHRRRAAKFGSEYIDPAKTRRADRTLVLEARKERLARPGFATGIDMFSKEEQDKRANRAARFGATEEAKALQYAPDEDELAKARRAKKFGVEYVPADGAMMEMDLFEERAEVPHDAERRYDAIYLYGVDVMSTGDCLSYFGEYGPTFVEWINDSACVVVFTDRHSAARAMVGVGRPLPAEEMTGESSTGLDPTDPSNMPYFWHKGRDFIKQGTPVHLIYRMACVSDKKDVNAPRKTRELWKLGSKQGGGGYKSRRTRGDQSAGASARVDRDGDVEMGDASGDGTGDGDVEMRRRRGERGGRRRKHRLNNGGTGVMETDDHVQGSTYGGLDYGDDTEEKPGVDRPKHTHNADASTHTDTQQQGAGQQHQNGGGGGDGPVSIEERDRRVDNFLRKMVKAKRVAAKQEAQQPRRHQGEADAAEPGPDALAQHAEPASAAME